MSEILTQDEIDEMLMDVGEGDAGIRAAALGMAHLMLHDGVMYGMNDDGDVYRFDRPALCADVPWAVASKFIQWILRERR